MNSFQNFEFGKSQRGLGVCWDVDLYGELLKIGGGKERYFLLYLKPNMIRTVIELVLDPKHLLMVCWDALYRMTAYFNKVGWPEKAPTSDEERKEFIASLHKRKTELFMALIEKKLLPLRPGVVK